ncbi:unnamed protein product [Gadus morhua 'NCC']
MLADREHATEKVFMSKDHDVATAFSPFIFLDPERSEVFLEFIRCPHLTPGPLAWIPFTLTPSEALSDRPGRKEPSVKTRKHPRDVSRAVSPGVRGSEVGE